MNKDEAAALLIEWHFHIEPHLREVFRILSEIARDQRGNDPHGQH